MGWISSSRKGLETRQRFPHALVAAGAAQGVWGYQHGQSARAVSPPEGWQCKAQLEFLGLYILLEGLNK